MKRSFFVCLVILSLVVTSCTIRTATRPDDSAFPEAGVIDTISEEEANRLFELAETYYRNNFQQKALEHYLMLVENYPNTSPAPAALYKIGQIHLSNNSFDKAQYFFHQLVSEHPDSHFAVEGYYQLGVCHLRLEQYEQAVQALAYYVNVDSAKRVDEAKILLGDCYTKLRQYADALLSYASVDPHVEREQQVDILKKVRILLDEHIPLTELVTLIPRLRSGPVADFSRYRAAQELVSRNQGTEAARLLREIDFANKRYKFYDKAQKLLEIAESSRAGLTEPDIGLDDGMDAITGPTPSTAKYAIGLLLPLSGQGGVFGREVLHGIMQGAGLFGRQAIAQYKVLVRDTRGDPEIAAQAVDELAQDPRVLAIIGPLLSNCAPAAADAAERNKIPLLTLTRHETITDQRFWTFRNFLTASDQVRALIDYATHQQGALRFAVLYPDNKQGRLFRQLFQKYLDTMRYRIVAAISYPADETDFRQTIRALKAAGPVDAIFIPDTHRRVALLAPQLVYYGVKDVMLLGINRWNNPSLVRGAGPYLTRAVFVDGFFPQSTNPDVADFTERFQSDYGHEPSFLAAVGFDTAKMIAEVLSSPSVRDRASLRYELLTVHDFPGVTGDLSTGEDRNIHRRLYLLRVGEQRIEELY